MSLYFRPEKAVLGDVIPYYDNGVFKPFYLRNYRANRDEQHQDSWVMLSTTDHIHYTEHDTKIVGGTGSVIKVDGLYHMFYCTFQKLPEKMEQFLASESCEAIPKYASQYFNHNSVFFIGRNLDYALGLEGSLKLKEISYIHSEAYASGELKHGTISLIEDGTLVIALGTYAPLFDKAMSNVVEVKARGADVLALATESHRGEMAKTVENVITIPDTAQMLLPSLGVVPLQLLAYYIALQRGCDIDKPRNLAKSVTVE